MIGKVFWFAVGAGSAVYTAIKIQGLARQATPRAIGQRVTDSVATLGEEFSSFVERARAAMAEREAELRAEMDPLARDRRSGDGRALDHRAVDLPRARLGRSGLQD
ncbi:MAG TPA: hypothetical protein VEQ66_05180 [Propionibacteriaceae bacterium]|nr:hypothetical protein [Propionibacteriaceae bacterium]